MLDTDTKRRIDTARDILVGKVPDPKSQVEQITIALIYKFMDDMDAEAEELGGHRKFFAGEFTRYGWAKLMRSGLGGHETLNLYAEGITKMPENPGIPHLFRDIFKNAYLPYRDPETLRSFLKVIDEFTYDHSERLGDAFEYLLSVLGSQGDAGQFRTPRHIIDFIVSIIDPQKHESVLDPACGTAGFLISSYKHILKANTNAKGQSLLTPDERGRLAQNFRGYDISPDMVRLSLVNLYLHGFPDPHIFEYDTLTQQERWAEYADVILANPPFMSPKGGIKPHRRFSIQAKRSEVLFVDYMAEHLAPTGRAGIIVPEGIIFQSQGAYTELRRMLVENSLVAVVSLPAGVFQPYSGVKTSILILDKSLARQGNTIAFFKMVNDGFSLGAQRREIDKNDLPQVREELSEYLRRLRERESVENFQPALGLVVTKDRIAEGGDYNLSGERYRKEAENPTHGWPMVALGEVIDELESGVSVNSAARQTIGDEIGVLKTSCVTSGRFVPDEHKAIVPDERDRARCPVRRNSIIISRMNTEALVGANAFIEKDYPHLFLPDRLWQTVISRTDIEPRFIQYMLASGNCRSRISASCGGTSGSMKNISKPQFLSIQIPLPPLGVQKEIVAEIEGYQKIIDGARTVLDNYRPYIPIHRDWPMVALEDACEIQRGKFSHRPRNEPRLYGGKYPFIQTGDVVRANGGRIVFTQTLNEEGLSVSKLFQPPVVVITIAANIGDTAVLDFPSCFPDSVVGLIPKSETDARYLEVIMRTKKQYLNDIAPQAAQKNINIEILRTVEIPLPPLITQKAIVAEIEAEQGLVNANLELIARMEKKIQVTLARVWG